MKRLLQELKEYKAASIKAPLFMIGEVGLELGAAGIDGLHY